MDDSSSNSNSASPSNISALHHSDGSLKSTKSKGQLTRRSGGIFSNPFRTDREKMDQLTEILNQYSQHGIPDYNNSHFHPHHQHQHQHNQSSCDRVSIDQSLGDNENDYLYLEEHWRCLVHNSENLPKKLQSQQDAIWELLHTEVFYIKRLKVISDLFLTCLHNLQSECLLNDVSKFLLFICE